MVWCLLCHDLSTESGGGCVVELHVSVVPSKVHFDVASSSSKILTWPGLPCSLQEGGDRGFSEMSLAGTLPGGQTLYVGHGGD